MVKLTCKTAEQIVTQAQTLKKTKLGQRRFINAEYRRQDDSSKWPIRGRFNVTDCAIRNARKHEEGRGKMSLYEYALFLEADMSRIVNNPKNWR